MREDSRDKEIEEMTLGSFKLERHSKVLALCMTSSQNARLRHANVIHQLSNPLPQPTN